MKVVSVVVLFAGLAFPFCYVRYGLNYTDEPYQILNAMAWREAPATWLCGWLASCWASWAGWGIIAMRCFECVIKALSVLAGCALLYGYTRKLALTCFAGGVTAWLSGLSPIFSWNGPSTMFVLFTLYLLLWAIRRRNFAMYAAVGLVGALAMMARMPNVVIFAAVPLVLVVESVVTKQYRRSAAAFIIFAVTYATTCVALMTIVYGSVAEYVSLLKATLVTNHSLTLLIRSIVETFYGSTPYWCVIAAGGAAVYGVWRLSGRERAVWVMSALVTLYIAGRLVFSVFEAYNQTFRHLALGLIAVVTALGVAGAYRRGDRSIYVTVAAMALFMVIPMAGSNVGFIKVTSVLLYPLAIWLAWPVRSRAAMIYFGSVAALLVVYVPVKNYFSLYEDAGVRMAVRGVDNERLRGVITSPDKAADLAELNGHIAAAQGTDIVFETDGPYGFMGYYMAGTKPPYAANEWTTGTLNNPAHVAECLGYLDTRDSDVTVVLFKKDLPAEPSLLERALAQRAGCRVKEDTGRYRVYACSPR